MSVSILFFIVFSLSDSFSFNNRDKLLMIYDHSVDLEDYSTFISILSDKFSLTQSRLADGIDMFFTFGQKNFDHIVLMTSTINNGIENFKNFLSNNGNIMILLPSNNYDQSLAQLTSSFGLNIVDDLYFKIGKDDLAEVIDSNLLNPIKSIIGDHNFEKFHYIGKSLLIDPSHVSTINLLSHPVGNLYNEKSRSNDEYSLISVNQLINNARVAVSGSVKFFSDKLINLNRQANSQSDNLKLIKEIIDWAFCLKSIIKISSTSHSLKDQQNIPVSSYSLGSEMLFSANLMHKVNNKWLPYIANDVTIELIRADPITVVRIPHILNGQYQVTMKLPNILCVCNLTIDYRRHGFNYVSHGSKVVIRPKRHDDIKRFTIAQLPYYLVCFVMMFLSYAIGLVYFKQKPNKIKSE